MNNKSDLENADVRRVRAEVRHGVFVVFVRSQPEGQKMPRWVSRASQTEISTRMLLTFPLAPQERQAA